MAYQSLYLTYRPQTFKEIAGQKPIVQTLQNALKHNKIAHAYLFAGPRGTGKTSMARLFAKALNCEDGLGHQCCKCSNCLSVKQGNHPDVIEIDAASNNGVEQVRQLIDKVSYSPIKGKYKIYIIDEVHMMTNGAFNALLKTLEEPPANVVFILCTTEPHKIIPTIISRCQRFDFAKLNEADMSEKLVEVLNSENATYTENGINTVVNIADGGMRDALSILDQVLAYSDNKLDEQDVLDIFGLASTIEKVALLKAVATSDMKSVINYEQTYTAKGIDIRRLTNDLISICKDEIIYIKTLDSTLLTAINQETAKELQGYFNLRQLSSLISILLEAQNGYRYTTDIRTLFDLSLIKFISANNCESVSNEPEVIPAQKEQAKVVKKQISKPTVTTQKENKPKEQKPVSTPIKQETSIKTATSTTSNVVENKAPVINKKPVQDPTEPPAFLFDKNDKLDEEKTVTKSAPVESKPVVEKTVKPQPTPVEKPKKASPAKPVFEASKIKKPNIAISGPTYTLSNQDLINVMCLGRDFQSDRKKLISLWPNLTPLKLDSTLGSLATLLSQGAPFCYCKEVLLLSYDFENLAKKVNIQENQEALSDLIEQLCGKKLFVYAVGPNERTGALSDFYNLMRINKLPNNKDITLSLPKDL